jgi:hypothetical protein
MPRGDNHPLKGKGKGFAFLQSLVGHRGAKCVLWPFAIEYNGYGQFGHYGKMHRAHKFMCELANGPPPADHEAAHSCGVARCVNPLHLSWKTRSENELDKRDHGTASGGAGGIGGCRTRLGAEQIADIRANKGRIPAAALAKKHGIKRGGVRYWQSTNHDPYPPGSSGSAISRRRNRVYPHG